MSPALFLAHELGHAEQEVNGGYAKKIAIMDQIAQCSGMKDYENLKKLLKQLEDATNEIERANVAATDFVIGKQLNELGIKEFIRHYYYAVTEYTNYSSFYNNLDFLIYYSPHFNDYGSELTAG